MLPDAAGVCTIQAPCKINLHLKVGEKRPDGFHGLESLFVSLAFGDTLRFEKNGDCPLLTEKNLVSRAVSLFRDRTGFGSELCIHLDKRIPVGAGLGGGSSDAASTLLALNFLSGAALPMEELEEMAALLGSDVPFFLTGGAAWVSGRGELVEPVNFPGKLWVLLVMPPFSSDTTSAFRLLDQVREHESVTEGAKFPGEALSREALVRALEDDPAIWPFHNDFLPVFLNSEWEEIDPDYASRAGMYRAAFEMLREAGASFAGLSGSGSCCFGIFTVEESAQKAEKELSKQGNFVRLTFFLAHRPDPVVE